MNQLVYYFLLGRTPELSFQELKSLVSEAVTMISPEIAAAKLSSDQEAKDIFNQLGGSIKVMRDEGHFTLVDDQTIYQYLAAFLDQSDRPTFALAEFGRKNLQRLAPDEIKHLLKEKGKSSRYIESERDGLSASVLLHHKNVVELNVIQTESEVILAQTIAVQDIDDWTRRDRQKPYADRKKGMLPPKLARLMINLGQQETQRGLLYDPFCGSGTVLLEGLMKGYQVVGSDLDRVAIQGTQENLAWFADTYNTAQNAGRAFQADATGVHRDLIGAEVNIIVTEPFLGKQTPNPEQLPNVFKGLEKLYLGAFKQWTKILAKSARVVIVFPYTEVGKHVYSLESLIDKLKSLGYTPLLDPVVYARPQAVIQRQIWVFEFKGNEYVTR